MAQNERPITIYRPFLSFPMLLFNTERKNLPKHSCLKPSKTADILLWVRTPILCTKRYFLYQEHIWHVKKYQKNFKA